MANTFAGTSDKGPTKEPTVTEIVKTNRPRFDWVPPGAWPWVGKEFFGDGKRGTMSANVILIGPPLFLEGAVDFLTSRQRLLDAGMPIGIKKVILFGEDVRLNPEGIKAGKRYHRHFTKEPIPENGPFDASLFDTPRFRKLIDKPWEAMRPKVTAMSWAKPWSAEGMDLIREHSEDPKNPRWIVIFVGYPYFFPMEFRKLTGEISDSVTPKLAKEKGWRESCELIEPGFFFGLHPNTALWEKDKSPEYLLGGRGGLNAYAGFQPFEALLRKCIKNSNNEAMKAACWALMGVGPKTFDDDALWIKDGPGFRLNKVCSGTISDPEEIRAACRKIVGIMATHVGVTLEKTLPVAVGQRVQSLYQHHQQRAG